MKQSIFFTLFMVILGTSALAPVKAQDDLIYVAVEPCRIVNTRDTAIMAKGVFRNFLVSGTAAELSVQGGGSTGDCIHPKAGTGVEPLAASAYIVAVPTGDTGGGWLTAFPAGTDTPTSSSVATVNYAKGQVVGNTTNVTLCQPDSCPTDGQLGLVSLNSAQHVVVDVQGYFYPQRQASAIRHLFGVVKYDSTCAQCHAAGTHDPDGSASDIAGKGNLLVNDLGTLSGAMNGIILTNQEVLDLQAFLDDPSIQP